MTFHDNLAKGDRGLSIQPRCDLICRCALRGVKVCSPAVKVRGTRNAAHSAVNRAAPEGARDAQGPKLVPDRFEHLNRQALQVRALPGAGRIGQTGRCGGQLIPRKMRGRLAGGKGRRPRGELIVGGLAPERENRQERSSCEKETPHYFLIVIQTTSPATPQTHQGTLRSTADQAGISGRWVVGSLWVW